MSNIYTHTNIFYTKNFCVVHMKFMPLLWRPLNHRIQAKPLRGCPVSSWTDLPSFPPQLRPPALSGSTPTLLPSPNTGFE